MADQYLAKMAIQIAANTSQFNTALSQSEKKLAAFTKVVTNTGKSIIGGFGLLEIGKGVINVTSEFEKFSAILTNTLGSSSEAQKALKDIREFSLSTPFEVSEVTAAYVRWANQGLSPTIDRMKKLGDVASSLGAGFEQTAEAFKDLAVGQTKRLEEIGISAQQANGKIQLSFKGVNLEIEKNAEGVQKALDVYSQLNGVLGTSDAVAQTLGGKISNLADAWDNFLLTLGNGSGGVIGKTVESLTVILNAVSNLSNELALIGQALSPFHDLRDLSKETLDYLIKIGRTDTGKRLSEILKPFQDQSSIDFLRNLAENEKDFYNTLEAQGESLEDINVLWDFYVKKRLAAAQADKEAAKNDRLKQVLDAKAQALAYYNLQLEENIKKEQKAQQERDKIANKRLERGAKVLLEFSQTDLVRLISEQAAAFKAEVKKHEEDFKVIVKVDDTQLTKLPSKITEIGPILTKAVQDATRGLKSVAEEAQKQMTDISSLVANGIANLADAMGTAIATGDFDNFGKAILSAVADFAQQLGGLLIAQGVAIKAFEFGDATTKIIAGAALVAAGAAIKGLIKNPPSVSGGASSGRSSGQTTRFETGGSQQIIFNGEFRVEGNALVAVINNTNAKNGRING